MIGVGLRGQNADDDGGDVVVAAVHLRFLDQGIDNAFRLGAGEEKLLDSPIVDHPGEPVAGEQKRVADARFAVEHIGLDLVSQADAAGDDVALRVASCLLGGEEARIDLLLDQRMVLGQLAHLSIAHQVDARISDMPDEELCFREEERRDGAAHPQLVALGAGALVDCPVGVAQRPRYPSVDVRSIQVVEVGEIVADHLDSHLARDFARGVPTHPVRDYE